MLFLLSPSLHAITLLLRVGRASRVFVELESIHAAHSPWRANFVGPIHSAYSANSTHP